MMHHKILLCSSIVLLFCVFSFTYGEAAVEGDIVFITSTTTTTTTSTSTSTTTTSTTTSTTTTSTTTSTSTTTTSTTTSTSTTTTSTTTSTSTTTTSTTTSTSTTTTSTTTSTSTTTTSTTTSTSTTTTSTTTHTSTTTTNTGTTITSTTTTTTKTTTKYYKPYDSGYGKYGSKKKYKDYGNNYRNDDDDGYDQKYYEIGVDGIDPRKHGTDMTDYGPAYANRPSMLSSMDIWITSANDWEQKETGSYNGRGRGNYRKNNKNRYNNDRNDDDDDDDKNNGDYRNKRSYSRVRFPVQRVKNFRQFPFGRFPPLISILPWLPIFYDKLTYQTFIFSPTGGIYIIPPLINFYGQRFAVAQLIKWGYASLVSTGVPPPPNLDVAPLVQPPLTGGPVAAGVVGSAGARPAPSYDSKQHRFSDGVKTDFPDFKARNSQNIQEGGNRNYGSNSRSAPDYGGSRNQQVYPQGGQRNSGSPYN